MREIHVTEFLHKTAVFCVLISFVNVCWNACIILPIPKRISIRQSSSLQNLGSFSFERLMQMAKVNLAKFARANCTVTSLFQKQGEIHWSCRPVMKHFATHERMRPSLKHSTPILQTKAQFFTQVWWYVVMAWPLLYHWSYTVRSSHWCFLNSDFFTPNSLYFKVTSHYCRKNHVLWTKTHDTMDCGLWRC